MMNADHTAQTANDQQTVMRDWL